MLYSDPGKEPLADTGSSSWLACFSHRGAGYDNHLVIFLQAGALILREGAPVQTDSRFFIIEDGAVECRKTFEVFWTSHNAYMKFCELDVHVLHVPNTVHQLAIGDLKGAEKRTPP